MPLTVSAVPDAAVPGVKPLIVGAPLLPSTVNGVPLVADPIGVVTAIVPVSAPEGTAATIWVTDAVVTVAATPLNVTVFWLGVALKPVPDIVTVEPTMPAFGVKSLIATAASPGRSIAVMFPTGSYR